MENKAFSCYTKEIQDRTVTGITALFGNVDYSGDRIHKGAFKKTIKENFRHFRHLWQHSYGQPPIARIDALEEVDRSDLPEQVLKEAPEVTGGLQVTRTYLETPRAEEVFKGIIAGALNEMSFAYDVIKSDFDEEPDEDGKKTTLIRNLRELRLWDTSDVNWGANPATVGAKAALPYRDTGTDEGDWSAPALGDFTSDGWADLSDAEKKRIGNHFAWAETLPPDNFGQLKLPHHRAGKSGVGPAVWRGVAAAMAALLGARGGVVVPDADRKSVYDHLAKHYAQFDKQPPDFKFVQTVYSILVISEDELAEYIKFCQSPSAVQTAFLSLKEMLLSAEPLELRKQSPTLTAAVLRKLELLNREKDLFNLRS